MAEIYTSSEAATLGTLSPETSAHINSVLADLGLGGTSAVAVQTEASGVAAGPGDAAVVALPSVGQTSVIQVGDEPVAVVLAGGGAVRIEGPGATSVHASDEGNTVTAGAGDGSIWGGLGADSLSGGAQGGWHALHAVGSGDTLAGGTGSDTLWGSETGASLLVGAQNGGTQIHAGAAGGDTIRSSGGGDTIYGGHATIYASGHSATIHADGDTMQAAGDNASIDGSASAQAIHVDSVGRFATILGGAGNDTIMLHDAPGGDAHVAAGAGDDHLVASTLGHGTLDGGTGDDSFLLYGASDSVIGGDGSDHFAILGHGIGHDTLDGGAGDDTAWFADRDAAAAHISHSGLSTFVSFDDGYSASLTGVEHLQFRDTVLSS